MAEEKKTQSYSNGGLVDALDGGMHHNAQYIDELAGLNDLVAGANARIYSATDADFDYDAFIAEQHAQNETWKTDAYKDLTNMCRTNALANGTAIVISAAAATTSVAGIVSKAGAAKEGGKLLSERIAGMVTNESSTLSKIAAKGASAVVKFGEGQASLAGKMLSKKVIGGAGRVAAVSPLRLLGAAAVELTPAALPLVTASIYTTGRTEEVRQEYQAAINTTNAAYEYLTEQAPDVETKVGQDYEAWRSGYETMQQQLLDQFQSGAITKEQYDAAYEQFVTESNESLQALNDQHKEMGQKIVENGAAGAAFSYAAKQGLSQDDVLPRSYYLQGLADKNPDTMTQWDTVIETQKENETGNSFTNFLANMNAAILHYAPGLAYVEAAVQKGVDVVLDFVSDKVPVVGTLLNYDEKYKGQSIGDLARAISTDAEERYERNHSINQAVAQMTGDGVDTPDQEQNGGQDLGYSPA